MGTKVATPAGWRRVENLVPGDRVLTVDHGFQKLRSIDRGQLQADARPCPHQLWPLAGPSGALGNTDATILLPEQLVRLVSDAAEAATGDASPLVAAAVLDGTQRIGRIEPHPVMCAFTPRFDSAQVVFVNIGAMFHCPGAICSGMLAMIHDAAAAYLPVSKGVAKSVIART